ncbi:hypothetical protein HXX76_003952 [Chlamydomonas incerta]|uniref:phytol kinase n=1 Tax=Chlamydomonas incerta TaxID=51695 RepID=A0A835W6E3_CHLIN|nr:hypothetical protein HXX76_003952 [Chlamydomonas incerta]|eukprot:KAG2441100.1 hypothetical protein HXX76_003952 [Chlamydomonas incerta]
MIDEIVLKLSQVNFSKKLNDILLIQAGKIASAVCTHNLRCPEKTLEALVAAHLSALYAVNERNIAWRTDLRDVTQATAFLFKLLPPAGSPFASRVARALLDAGLLDCYARIAAWVRARGAQAAAAASTSAAPAAAIDEDELANHCSFLHQACVMLDILVGWTSGPGAEPHARLCAALERSQLLEHAAVALVTLAAACPAVPPPSLPQPQPSDGAAGAAAPRAPGAHGGSAVGGGANPSPPPIPQDARNWIYVSDGASMLLAASATLAVKCQLGIRVMAPHPHPGFLTALKPAAGSLQAAERVRLLLGGRGFQFVCVWALEAARLAALEAMWELPGNENAVVATASGIASGGAPAAAAQPRAITAAHWLPPALARPLRLLLIGGDLGQYRQSMMSGFCSAVQHTALVWQLTASGPYVLPTAHPPAGSRPAGPCALAAPRAAGAAAAGAAAAGAAAAGAAAGVAVTESGVPTRQQQQLSAVQAFDALVLAVSTVLECRHPDTEHTFPAGVGVLSRLLIELRPRQAAARLPAVWRMVTMVLPQFSSPDLYAATDLLRLQLAGPDGSVLSCASGGAGAAPAGEVPVSGGPAYSLQCGLSAGLLPALERLLRDENALRTPEHTPASASGLLSTVNLTLRYSGVWPALLAHASLTEAVGLIATLGSVARFFGAHNTRDMWPVALGGVLGRKQAWGGGGLRLALGCYLAAMLEQCFDVRDPHQWRTFQWQQREVGASAAGTAEPGTPLWFNNAMEDWGQDPMQLGWLAAAGGAPPAGSAAAAQLDLLGSFALQDWLPPLVLSALAAIEPDVQMGPGVGTGDGYSRLTTPEPQLVLLVTQLLTRVAAQRVRLLVVPGPGAAREGGPVTGREPADQAAAGAASQVAPAAFAAAAAAEADAAPPALPATSSSWEQYLGPLYEVNGAAAELLFKLLDNLRDCDWSDSEEGDSEDEHCPDEVLRRPTLQLLAALSCTRPGLLVRWLAVELQSAVWADVQACKAPAKRCGAGAAATRFGADDHMNGVFQSLRRVAHTEAMPELVIFLFAVEVEALQRLKPHAALFARGVKPGMAAWEVCSAAEEAAAVALAPAAAELAAAVRGSVWLQRLLVGQAWLLAPAEVQARLRAAGIVLPDTRLGGDGSGSGGSDASRQDGSGSSGGNAGCSNSGSGSSVGGSGLLMRLCGNPGCSGLAGPSALIAPNSGKTCSRCRQLTYCCGACQLSHWREGHQTACAGAAAAAAASGRGAQGKSGASRQGR